jgi:membrane-bound inhibitor of C-type lysozyme
MLLSLGLNPAMAPLHAMTSPWWEDYDRKERYLCSDRGAIVVERNDSQASVITGRSRSTLFRDASEAPGLRYSNGSMRLILRGDELVLEQLPFRISCIRTEEV